MTLPKSNNFPKAPPPNTISVGVRVSTCIWGEHTHLACNRCYHVFRIISLKFISSKIIDCIKIVQHSFERLNKGKNKAGSHLTKSNQTKLKGPRATCSVFNRVLLFAAPWTGAHQAPLSMGLSLQEYWSGLPFLPQQDLPKPGIELPCLLQMNSLTRAPRGKPSCDTFPSCPPQGGRQRGGWGSGVLRDSESDRSMSTFSPAERKCSPYLLSHANALKLNTLEK